MVLRIVHLGVGGGAAIAAVLSAPINMRHATLPLWPGCCCCCCSLPCQARSPAPSSSHSLALLLSGDFSLASFIHLSFHLLSGVPSAHSAILPSSIALLTPFSPPQGICRGDLPAAPAAYHLRIPPPDSSPKICSAPLCCPLDKPSALLVTH